MVDLEIYTDKIAQSGWRIVERANEEAHLHGHTQLAPEHVLSAIIEIERPLFDKAMNEINRDPLVVMQALQSRLAGRRYIRGKTQMSYALRVVLSNALKHAHEHGRRNIESTDLLEALYKGKRNFMDELVRPRHSFLSGLLKRLGLRQAI